MPYRVWSDAKEDKRPLYRGVAPATLAPSSQSDDSNPKPAPVNPRKPAPKPVKQKRKRRNVKLSRKRRKGAIRMIVKAVTVLCYMVTFTVVGQTTSVYNTATMAVAGHAVSLFTVAGFVAGVFVAAKLRK